MAMLLGKIRAWLATPLGRVAQAAFFALLLIISLIFFTGEGQFIYEAF